MPLNIIHDLKLLPHRFLVKSSDPLSPGEGGMLSGWMTLVNSAERLHLDMKQYSINWFILE
jgi:hypothetical protein